MLGAPPAAAASIIRCRWAVNGVRAALTTTYLLAQLAGVTETAVADPASLSGVLNRVPTAPGLADLTSGLVPAAASVEVQAPPLGIASQLELRPGVAVISIAIRFDDPSKARPAALTVATLRCDTFRVIVESSSSASRSPGAAALATLAADE